VQIEALAQLIPALAGRNLSITHLSGGITNQNFRIDADGESYVVRVAGERTNLLGIDRAVEHACAIAASVYGLGPEVVDFLPEHGALITRFVPGRELTPEDVRNPATMKRIVGTLRRYHRGRADAGSFSPFDTVRTYFDLAAAHGVAFPGDLRGALRLLDRIEEAAKTAEEACPCHNDLLPANLIDNGRSLWIIDWEYAGMGDRFFDLGNLAVNNRFEERHERALLEMYFGEALEEHWRRLRLMRLASDMREAMWGFLQSGISRLDFDFLHYAHHHLQSFLAAVEQSPELLTNSVHTSTQPRAEPGIH
jgi:thiamine kinase-like enzyme